MRLLLVTTLFSLIAGIVGAYIIHWLTRSREHEVWVRDCTLREWRELLNELTKAYMTLLTHRRGFSTRFSLSSDAACGKALADADITLSTRIFIASNVAKLDLRRKWAELVDGFNSSNDKATFMKGYQSLWESIIEAATSIH